MRSTWRCSNRNPSHLVQLNDAAQTYLNRKAHGSALSATRVMIDLVDYSRSIARLARSAANPAFSMQDAQIDDSGLDIQRR